MEDDLKAICLNDVDKALNPPRPNAYHLDPHEYISLFPNDIRRMELYLLSLNSELNRALERMRPKKLTISQNYGRFAQANRHLAWRKIGILQEAAAPDLIAISEAETDEELAALCAVDDPAKPPIRILVILCLADAADPFIANDIETIQRQISGDDYDCIYIHILGDISDARGKAGAEAIETTLSVSPDINGNPRVRIVSPERCFSAYFRRPTYL